MKKILFPSVIILFASSVIGQVSPTTGRIGSITTNFSFNITDGEYNRPMLQQAWLSGVGDYLSIKHGGSNTENNTYGLRISDGLGFDFGKNDFATSFLKIKTNGFVGAGIANPLSKFHIYNGASGGSPHGYSHLTLEHNNHAMISILTPTNKYAYYGFGDTDDGFVGGMQYNHSDNNLSFRVNDRSADMVIDQNGNLGVGTSSPGAKLEVNSIIKINNPSNRGNGNLFLDRGSEGKDRAAIAFGENGTYGWYSGLLYSYGNPSPNFYINRTDYIRDQNGYRQPEFVIGTNGNVGIGVLTPDAKLAVNGSIHAKEVKVDLIGWPDYVFKTDYNLPTLEEVEHHIKEKGHLINIPSAKEVEKDGVQLGEMNKLLLEKIEELTLYTLQQEKRIKQLENLIKKP